ncbi:Fc receptor-like protein 5 isoform X2 [Ictalurus furcatus]|uniref:Fc receptor-like protein 5 isoform X2 n=1 Tax=Ictalurus furcatus TaxID=66913 RepID=UPI002350A49C|nr:Fc receptor-like protein 5 isoform X2 [Ictalurus furcatus]
MSHTHWSDSEEISIHTSCWTMSKRTFFLLVVLGFCAMWQEADAEIILDKPVLSGPSNSTLGSVEEFYCKLDKIPTNQTVLYQFFNKGNVNKILGEYSALTQEKAKFPAVISLAFDGQLICKASVQNNSEIIPTLSDQMKFQVIVPVKGAQIISSPSLEDLWEKDSLTLWCNITEGNFVLYDWFLDDNPLLNDSSNSHLLIPSLSSKNKGKYVCVAKNYYNETLNYTNKSEGVDVHVKEYLSQPEISFKIGKNAEGNFSAYVKCQVTKGSPPINYTFFRNNHQVAVVNGEHLNASFVVPIVLDQDMGTVYCQANNGKRLVQSRKLNLTVEYLSQPEISFKIGKNAEGNFSAYVKCQVTKGSPLINYTFFRNNHQVAVVNSEHLNASFVVPIVLDQDMGTVYCQANNGKRLVQSRKLNLTVEYLSQPEISFKIGKNAEGNFSAYVKCQVTKGSPPISYTLFRNNHQVAVVNSEHLNASFVVPIVLDRDMGTVYCKADNVKRPVQSRKLNLTVEYLSQPEISFKIGKNAEGNFSAYVKCQVTKGSPPISYTLFRNNHQVAVVNSEHLNASFVVPIVLDRDMGTVYCKADNVKRPVQSRKLNLTVESVGGNVTMSLEKAVGKDFDVYGVWLYCHVDKGTFPKYYWFLNYTRLESQGKFYRTFSPNHSGLMVRLDPSIATAGVYHCEVVNSFDNTSRVSSPRILITHEVFNKISTEVAAIIFTCFSLLICAVLACCVYGVVLRKRQARKYILKDFTDKHSIVDDDGVFNKIEETEEDEYEEEEHDDLDTEAYIEDTDVVQASMMEDFYEEL